MASKPDIVRLVDAEGTLRLDTPSGRSIRLIAEGEDLRLELPSWQDARAALPTSFRGRRRMMRFVANMLATHGLTLTLKSADKAVVRLGYNVAPSWLARLLGLAPAYIPLSAIKTFFR